MDIKNKATRINLLDFHTRPMRTFHMTWFAFFLCFFAWFGIAPLMAVVREDLSLTKEQIGQIVTLELAKVQKRLGEHNLTIEVSDEAKHWLGEKGYDPDYGARPLRRVIQNEVEDILSDGLLAGRFAPSSTVKIGLVDGKLVFEGGTVEAAPAEDAPTLAAPEASGGSMLFAAN